jgi:hypothetical protein
MQIMIQFECNNDANAIGTCFHEVTITASIDKMVRLFGEPAHGDGYKCMHDWTFVGSDGTVVTAYDYRYDGALTGYWNVGGKDKIACLKFVEWFHTQV